MKTEVRVSDNEIVFDFGKRLIVTGPGPAQQPGKGQPTYVSGLTGAAENTWEPLLDESKLGNCLTRFLKQLAGVPGAAKLEVYAKAVVLRVTPLAIAGPPAVAALKRCFDTDISVIYVDGRPLHQGAVPSHLGL